MNQTRRHQGASAWRDALARFELSGLSVGEYCQREGLSRASFYRWRLSLGSTADQRPADKAVGAANRACGFLDLGSLGAERSRVELRVDLGGGVIVQITRS